MKDFIDYFKKVLMSNKVYVSLFIDIICIAVLSLLVVLSLVH